MWVHMEADVWLPLDPSGLLAWQLLGIPCKETSPRLQMTMAPQLWHWGRWRIWAWPCSLSSPVGLWPGYLRAFCAIIPSNLASYVVWNNLRGVVSFALLEIPVRRAWQEGRGRPGEWRPRPVCSGSLQGWGLAVRWQPLTPRVAGSEDLPSEGILHRKQTKTN